MSQETIHFGVLFFPLFQWLDAVGPIDYINNHSKGMLTLLGLPKEMIDKAPVIEWHYISHNLEPVDASSGPRQQPSNTYDDCPDLNYLLVPGPSPTDPLPEGCAEFLQKRFADSKLKALLLVCTGSLAIAQSGILDGHHVCSNKWVMSRLAPAGLLNKNVHWIGDRRWHIDGKIWSAAGLTSGIDLAAEFSRQHFAEEIVKLGREMGEYDAKPAHPDTFAFICEGVKLN